MRHLRSVVVWSLAPLDARDGMTKEGIIPGSICRDDLPSVGDLQGEFPLPLSQKMVGIAQDRRGFKYIEVQLPDYDRVGSRQESDLDSITGWLEEPECHGGIVRKRAWHQTGGEGYGIRPLKTC